MVVRAGKKGRKKGKVRGRRGGKGKKYREGSGGA